MEFQTTLNSHLNGDKMVTLLIQEVCQALEKKYKVSVSERDVVELISSTPAKFSSHLIFKIPDCCFENNIQCGNFVKSLCNNLEERRLSEPRLNKLFVRNDKEQYVFFADLSKWNFFFCSSNLIYIFQVLMI